MFKFVMLLFDEKEVFVVFVRDYGKDKFLDCFKLDFLFVEIIFYVVIGYNEFKDFEGFFVNKLFWGIVIVIDLD